MAEETFIVALGSTRRPKVDAVRTALRLLRDRLDDFPRAEPEIVTRSVPSGIPSTPRSTGEMLRGARNRADATLEELGRGGAVPRFAIGLEGGVLLEPGFEPACWLEGWAYATDGHHGYFGSSGCIPVPAPLAAAVNERGEELGDAADAYFVRTNVAGRQGTFGVLTADLVSREAAFVRALLHALAPFYNASVYGD